MNEINVSLRDLQNSYSSVFENTADAKAKNDAMEWWILNLSLIEDEKGGYKPFYGEGDFNARMKALEDLEAQNDPFVDEVIKKLSYFISFWSTIGLQASQEQFRGAEDDYQSNVTDYLKPAELQDAPKDVVQPAPTGIAPTPSS